MPNDEQKLTGLRFELRFFEFVAQSVPPRYQLVLSVDRLKYFQIISNKKLGIHFSLIVSNEKPMFNLTPIFSWKTVIVLTLFSDQ